MHKLSDYNLVPKHLLVLPQFDDHSGSVLQVSSVNKELSIGQVVKHNSGRFILYFYPHAADHSVPHVVPDDKVFNISYKRAASQSIKLVDENGDETEYKVVHEDDITGWFTSSEITA